MHKVQFRVYYEDTDCGGVVYHSRYLNFIERGRTELLRSLGINQQPMAQTMGIFFVVTGMKIKFIKPAKLDDMVEIQTKIIKISPASIELLQNIFCEDKLLFESEVKIVCVEKKGEEFFPKKLPDFIKQSFQKCS